MKPRVILMLAFVTAISIPSVALANAGTPLMWATMSHMVLGNACIGLLEGALLALVYGVPTDRAIGLMIFANYFSAWLGWIWLPHLMNDFGHFDLYNTWPFLWVMVAVAYVVTLVLEWPFVAGCFRGRSEWFRRSCIASILLQSCSYVLLFGWYGFASGISLFTKTSIVPLNQISLPVNVCVYYIADDDGDVYRRELNTGRTEKVYDLNSTDLQDCLSFGKSTSSDDVKEIVALLDRGIVPIGVKIPNDNCPRIEPRHFTEDVRWMHPGRGFAYRLGSANESPWNFEAGYWPISGLSGENSRTGANIRFALETPFIQWDVRHATLLPTECVLFQFGKRQICVFEANTLKIAVLSFGRGAVAVLEHREPESGK